MVKIYQPKRPSVKSIIPVGKSLGPFIEDGEVKYFDLHLGNEIEELNIYEIATWALAHTDPDAQLEQRFDRELLMAEIRKENDTRFPDDMERDINRLIELGAFVEIDLKNDSLEPFLSKHVFIPTGDCYGNVGEDLELFGIGRNEEPYLWVPRWTQIIWASSYRNDSIWDLCREIAEGIDNVAPQDVAENYVKSLPALIASKCGYLEPKLWLAESGRRTAKPLRSPIRQPRASKSRLANRKAPGLVALPQA